MKKLTWVFSMCLVAIFTGCGADDANLAEDIVGKWRFESVDGRSPISTLGPIAEPNDLYQADYEAFTLFRKYGTVSMEGRANMNFFSPELTDFEMVLTVEGFYEFLSEDTIEVNFVAANVVYRPYGVVSDDVAVAANRDIKNAFVKTWVATVDIDGNTLTLSNGATEVYKRQ